MENIKAECVVKPRNSRLIDKISQTAQKMRANASVKCGKAANTSKRDANAGLANFKVFAIRKIDMKNNGPKKYLSKNSQKLL